MLYHSNDMSDLLELKVVTVKRETPSVASFFLERIDSMPIHYKAGQFLTLLIQRGNKMLRRSYSMSSTPGLDLHLCITVKAIENGEVSRFLLNSLLPGSIVRALPPAGLFTLDVHPAERKLLFIAAGSGITPIYSLIRHVLHFESTATCCLIYQSTNQEQTIFLSEIESLQQQFGSRLKLYLLYSRPTGTTLPARLTKDTLIDIIERAGFRPVSENRVFICGPLSFMRLADFTVRFMGYKSRQIRMENFVVDSVPAPRLSIDSTPRHVSVLINNQYIEFNVQYPQSILEAALANHIELPYSCRGGRCSSCIAHCTDGAVQMSINEVLTDDDLAKGLVLTCVGYAASDLKLRFEIVSPNEPGIRL